jgi:short-subunit dehydrogenase
MSAYTLITGASKGIGKAFAIEAARRGHNLILVARDADQLNTLAKEIGTTHKVRVHTYAQDLTRPDAPKGLANFCQRHHYTVDTLINNAGIGLWGKFDDLDLAAQINSVQINVTAIVALTHAMLPLLKTHKKSYVLNVASTAAFFPTPYFSVYAAAKAFVLSFSQALRYELKPDKILVSCLCPGPTESDFVKTAKMESFRFNRKEFFMPAEKVAKAGLDGLKTGKPVIIPGASNQISAYLASTLPSRLMARVAARIYKP